MPTYTCDTFARLAAVLLLLLAIGCDGQAEQTVPVTGTVTLDGQPLNEAYVTFIPLKRGRPSSARTDASGRYQLIYARGVTGALPGDYSVEIRTYVAPLVDAEDFERRQGAPEQVPAQYNADTTLTAKVVSGSNTIDFDLDSAGEIKLPPGAEGGGYGEGGYGDDAATENAATETVDAADPQAPTQ